MNLSTSIQSSPPQTSTYIIFSETSSDRRFPTPAIWTTTPLAAWAWPLIEWPWRFRRPIRTLTSHHVRRRHHLTWFLRRTPLPHFPPTKLAGRNRRPFSGNPLHRRRLVIVFLGLRRRLPPRFYPVTEQQRTAAALALRQRATAEQMVGVGADRCGEERGKEVIWKWKLRSCF